ncbi:MAG: amino acid permease [Streptococcaceae bacterium]|jgi:APA family basic amino acid/polyamine antiporter|nr:amino acid permease [Streptococcaceae bacterium]
MKFFRTKKIPQELETTQLNRNLKTTDLLILGIGAIVGTGIFTITGIAASEYAGPASSLSFLITSVAVGISGLFYAEFASRIPVIGGPYAYLYSVLGEGIAWVTGWLMIVEFILATSSVASGWAGYLQGLLNSLEIYLPKALRASFDLKNGTYVDILAMLVLFFVTLWVLQEAKKMLRLNHWMIYVKFGIIALFVVVGIFFIRLENWVPFMPYGFIGKHGKGGVMAGAALVFFAYLGFESVPMAVEEVDNPQKRIPQGVLGSITLAAVFYIIVTLVLTGIVSFDKLKGIKDPVAYAMRTINQPLIASIISIVAVLTLLTVCISMLYSLSRLIYAISKDGLLPKSLQKVDRKTHVPKNATFVAGGFSMIFAGIVPLNLLAEFVNIATLMYLIFMAIGIIILRKKFGKPNQGEFKTPLVPILPILSIIISGYLMFRLQIITWIVFTVALALGFIIYFCYGRTHSLLNEKK